MILRRNESEDDPPRDDDPPRRRTEDRLVSAVGRVTVAVMLALGGGGAGWLAKDRVAQAAPQAVVDQAARDAAREASASVVLLRAEMAGDLKALRQQQDVMAETLRELRDEARRRGR